MEIIERDAGCFRYCELNQLGHAAAFDVDSFTHRSAGGQTVLRNLALQRLHCGLKKSNKRQAEVPLTGQPYVLFHPLLDKWHEHFSLGDRATIVGLSRSGRATMSVLEMNQHR